MSEPESTKYISLGYEECASYVKSLVLQLLDLTSEANVSITKDIRSLASSYWMVFDVDGVLLSDAKYKGQYKGSGDVYRFMYKGNHDPIQPLVNLYNWCVSFGFNMCIITGRASALEKITQSNLNKVGITTCHRFYTKKGKEDAITYKSRCRKEILDAGGIILCNIGDQENDLLIANPSNGQHIYGYAQHAIKLPSTY